MYTWLKWFEEDMVINNSLASILSYTSNKTDWSGDIQRDRQTDRKAARQTDKQTGRQKDRQTANNLF